MAFNFSKIEMSHYVTQRKPPKQQPENHRPLPTPLESAWQTRSPRITR